MTVPTPVDFDVCAKAEGIYYCKAGYIWVYHGSKPLVSCISDVGGTNAYIEAENFTRWVVSDPGGDDVLFVGGIPMALNPGTLITLTNYGVRIEYRAAGGGQNEWVIESTQQTETVFVWDDGSGKWNIYYLDY